LYAVVLDSKLKETGELFLVDHAKGNKKIYAQRNILGYLVFGEKEKIRQERRLNNEELTNQLGHIFASLEVFLRIGLKPLQLLRLKIAKEMIREVFEEFREGK